MRKLIIIIGTALAFSGARADWRGPYQIDEVVISSAGSIKVVVQNYIPGSGCSDSAVVRGFSWVASDSAVDEQVGNALVSTLLYAQAQGFSVAFDTNACPESEYTDFGEIYISFEG